MQAIMPRTLLRAKRRTIVCPQTHKQGYRTRKKSLKFAELSSTIHGKKLYVYHCLFCDRWHMSSQAPRPKAAE